MASKSSQDIVEGLIDKLEPALAASFRSVIRQMKNQLDLDLVARLLTAGQVDAALEVAMTGFNQFANATTGAYVTAGQTTASWVNGNVAVSVVFDQVNTRAVQNMQDSQLNLIRNFTQEQRDTTRIALTRGIQEGQNPRQQARTFRDSLGLTTRQEAAVANYRRLLQENDPDALNRKLRDARSDSAVLRAIRNGTPLTDAQIDSMTSRYAERYVKYRSEVIGRTEALRAVHQGHFEQIQQAIDGGVLEAGSLIREWHTARDSRVRDSHKAMNGQKVSIQSPFSSGDGNLLRYPGDPSAPASETVQCRCAVSTRITSL